MAVGGGEAFVASLAILLIFGGPVALFLGWRYFAHRERMEMIRAGMIPGTTFSQQAAPPGSNSKTVFVPNVAACQASLARGIRTTAIGFALLIGLSFIGYHGDGEWRPGAWLLGGLVPFFVGLAQIATALLSGATFRPAGWQAQPGPADPPLYSVPNPPPAGGGSGQNFTGPYAYRPPSDVSELPKPAPPKTL
jgi:hypothetical protein